jgi:hypothetical protein
MSFLSAAFSLFQLFSVYAFLFRRFDLQILIQNFWIYSNIQTCRLFHNFGFIHRSFEFVSRHPNSIQDNIWSGRWSQHNNYSNLFNICFARSYGRTCRNSQSVVHNNWYLFWILDGFPRSWLNNWRISMENNCRTSNSSCHY